MAGLWLAAATPTAVAHVEPYAPGTTALVELTAAPEAKLALRDLDGQLHDLAAYRGQVVIVNFWATWCAPCVTEMAVLERAARDHWPAGIRLLAVNAGDPEPGVRRFVERTGVSFPVLLDRGAAVSRAWQVTALPVTYVIGRDGRVKAGALGVRAWDHPEIAAALARWQQDGN